MPDIQRVIKFSLMHKTTIKNDIMKTERLRDGTDNFIIGDFFVGCIIMNLVNLNSLGSRSISNFY